MLNFLSANFSTIIVGIVVFSVIGLVVVKLVRDKINHKSNCGCGCANCPSASACHHK